MQRQKSILSFFQKPPPAVHQNAPFPSSGISSDSSLEIRGTDTPPEKVPRQILPGSFPASDASKGHSLFSSIMHKFVKTDPKEKPLQERVVESKELFKQGSNSENSIRHNAFSYNDDDDFPGPDTPGTQPVVPQFKRVCEEIPKVGDEKRARLLQEPVEYSKSNVGTSDWNRKFEWLDPLWIKDANGRRPGDPLYDKNTLYIPPDVLKKMSASQKQYWNVKSQYMDVVLFFKVGKFYELYELDAEIGHKELDWKMTLSGVGKCRQVGISESGIDDAVEKLVARGYKVGRIEQLETSDQAKARGANSVIPRKLVQVVTPSTAVSGNIGPDAVHLLAIKEGSYQLDNGASSFGFAFVDCSTQQFWIGSIIDDASCSALGALLMQVSPREVIYESSGLSKEAVKTLKKYCLSGSTATQLTPVLPATDFVDASEVRKFIHLKGYFRGSASPWSNALDNVMDVALSALGALIGHLSRLMLGSTLHGGDILPYHVYMGCLRMDGQTLVNLEIFTNTADGGTAGTLFKYLDNCVISSGKRALRRWICHPLKHVEAINNRLNVVEALMAQSEIMLMIAQHLRKLPDLERMLGQLKASFQSTDTLVLPLRGKKVLKQRVKVFGSLVKGLRIGIDLLSLLCKEGQIIGLLLKIFELPELNGDAGIAQLLAQLEAAVDSEFPNYQNHDVSDSEAETLSVLIELFMEKAMQWSQVIQAISCIDVLRSFAVTASMSCGAMSRPIVLPQSKPKGSGKERVGPLLKIKGLWHPFALGLNGELPVPNDLSLGEDSDGNHPHSLLLTGPNMGGKSTLLRATCLAVILAQLGCFVPSERCVLSLVDVIFTRLGATDRIMTGESTFLVECTETASVLQNATQDSLVILDELGRGTSTFDGYAIAYAVFRHLVERINCRLLFATHYHPLTKEFASHPRVMMQHMACAFKSKSEGCSVGDQDLVFLYRLKHGPCPESYGLQVALMAGIPEKVVEAASEAGQEMKKLLGNCFKSSKQRSEFSTLHEEWLRTLINISEVEACNLDDDAYDTLVCLWHEVNASYQSCN